MSRLPLLAVVLCSSPPAAAAIPRPHRRRPPPTTTRVHVRHCPRSTKCPRSRPPMRKSGGQGHATITFNVTRDAAGAITAGTVDVVATFTGFPQRNGPHPGPHSHRRLDCVRRRGGCHGSCGGRGHVPQRHRLLREKRLSNHSPVDTANQIIANPAAFYFNVHTATNPGGVVRGQWRSTSRRARPERALTGTPACSLACHVPR